MVRWYFLSHRASYGRMWGINRTRDGSVSDSDWSRNPLPSVVRPCTTLEDEFDEM